MLVSIIIPCYNAAQFIAETLNSVCRQTYTNLEIIVIDDGSTDNSAAIIAQCKYPLLHYYYQNNAGVSAARNNGLALAKGDVVVFFDADDLMTPRFVEKRVLFLTQNPALDFCCGDIQTFPTPHQYPIPSIFEHIIRNIALHTPLQSSCPSAYMFRRKKLLNKNLTFCTELSSSADRFFLLQLSLAGLKGNMIAQDPEARLLYRVHTESMSHKLSPRLVQDQTLFYQKITASIPLPTDIRRHFCFSKHYILGVSYLKLGSWHKGIYHLLAALKANPIRFGKQLATKL